MPTDFYTPDSPAWQLVEKLLAENTEGLSSAQIVRELLRRGHRLRESDVLEILDHPDTFLYFSDGRRYRLRSAVDAEEEMAAEAPSLTAPRDVEATLLKVPDLTDCVLFDLETTGLNPERDAILQIAALRVVDGEPREARNWYVHPGEKPIPYSVKLKLNFDKFPDIEAQIYAARPLEEVLPEFLAFVGPRPLVAHNAQFDFGFLKAAAPEWAQPREAEPLLLDTMELAVLLRPELERHKLEFLAEQYGYAQDGPRAAEIEAAAGRLGLPFDWERFHDAQVDCLVLHFLLHELRNTARSLPIPLKREFYRLLPTLANFTGEGTTAFTSPEEPGWTQIIEKGRETPGSPPLTTSPPDFSPAAAVARLQAVVKARSFRDRAQQEEMTRTVAEALDAGEFALIEAPTATGKTLAYLIPAILWARATGQRVAISTPVKNLQDQLIKDLAELQNDLGLEFRFQPLRGRTSYACRRKFAELYQAFDPATASEPNERLALAYLLHWFQHNEEGCLEQTNYWLEQRFRCLTALKEEIRGDAETCTPARCRDYGGCPHEQAYLRAQAADVLVLNHALLLSKDWGGLPFQGLVVDEAHQLEEACTNTLTEEVSREKYLILLRKIRDPRTGRGIIPRLRALLRDAPVGIAGKARAELNNQAQRTLAALNRSLQLVDDFGQQLKQFLEACDVEIHREYGASFRLLADPARIRPGRWKRVRQAQRQLLDSALRDLVTQLCSLREVLAGHPLPPPWSDWLHDLTALIGHFINPDEDRELGLNVLFQRLLRVDYDPTARVHWLEVSLESSNETEGQETVQWAIRRAPVRVDQHLQENLYAELHAAVFTSATLTTAAEKFGFFLDRLGLEGKGVTHPVKTLQLPPVLRYEERALLAITRYFEHKALPSEMEGFKEEVAQELTRLFQFTDGKGLGLFTARSRLEYVADRIEGPLSEASIPLYAQRPGQSRRALQEEFGDRLESVLLGLKSFWQGIDIPGETLTYVVMEKLPFPRYKDPVIEARSDELARCGENPFERYLLPLTIIEFKQGFGRLLRRDEDIGAALLLDRRVWEKNYLTDLLQSLPGYKPVPDAVARSRKQLYLAIARHLEGTPAQIDLDAKADLLATLEDRVRLDIEQRLAEFALPFPLSEDELARRWNQVVSAIPALFNFSGFRAEVPEQAEVVRVMLTGRDALVILPTGSGKSFCFQLPALLHDGLTLVFSPLIALMKNQVDALRDRDLTVVDYIYTGQRAEERERVYEKMINGRTRLVYISPERLRDPRLVETLRKCHIAQVVVDEAHCVHLWGQTFRPDFLALPKLFAQLPERPPIAAFTATATPEIQQAIAERLELQEPTTVTRSANRPELRFLAYNANTVHGRIRSRADKLALLLRILQEADRRREAALIYTSTVREAEQLTRQLSAAFNVRCYHGRMEGEQRTAVQDDFLDGRVDFIVATKAFGMGIDKPDIRYIIHWQIPGDLESYYQEVGRAGRDGKPAYAVLLYHKADVKVQEYFIAQALPEEAELRQLVRWLRNHYAPQMAVDPVVLEQEVEVDETKLGLMLHLLEEGGWLERKHDFTRRAAVTVLTQVKAAVAAMGATHQPLLAAFFDAYAASSRRRVEVDLLAAAQTLRADVEILERALIRLAMDGHLLLRGWERGYLIEPTARLRSAEPFTYDATEAERHLEIRRRKLRQMVRYAESYGEGGCRRQDVLRYFGETTFIPNEPSACCDRCDLNLPVPWAHLTSEDVPSLTDYLDPAYEILRAVRWNETLADEPGRAPYSRQTLTYLLAGQDFPILQNTPDEATRRRRRARLHSSEFFGLLEDLRGRQKAVNRLLTRLEQEGYVMLVQEPFGEGQGSYARPGLTEKGRGQLRSAQRLGWD